MQKGFPANALRDCLDVQKLEIPWRYHTVKKREEKSGAIGPWKFENLTK